MRGQIPGATGLQIITAVHEPDAHLDARKEEAEESDCPESRPQVLPDLA
jgi:hypothetical protein